MTEFYYNNLTLTRLLNKYSIPTDSYHYNTLKEMFYCGAIMNYNNLIQYIKYLRKNTEYRGISCIQALDLISVYYNSEFYDENNKNDKKIMEHKICGLILDTWNIQKYSTNLGSCSCYYKYSLDEFDRLCVHSTVTSLAFSENDDTNNVMFSFWKNQIK